MAAFRHLWLHLVLPTTLLNAQLISPLITTPCPPWNSSAIVCVNHYSSVMPEPFYRNVPLTGTTEDTYGSTNVPNDPSFTAVANANFVVFDRQKAMGVLGPNPILDFVFMVDPVGHEGPVYIPELNKLYITQIQLDFLPQLVVDLNQSPPSLSYQVADPPIYVPTGGYFHNGLIYYSTIGGGVVNNQTYRPGIYSLNATSGKSTPLLNNYFGYYFNGCDDIVVDSTGDIWFTDNGEQGPGNKVISITNHRVSVPLCLSVLCALFKILPPQIYQRANHLLSPGAPVSHILPLLIEYLFPQTIATTKAPPTLPPK